MELKQQKAKMRAESIIETKIKSLMATNARIDERLIYLNKKKKEIEDKNIIKAEHIYKKIVNNRNKYDAIRQKYIEKNKKISERYKDRIETIKNIEYTRRRNLEDKLANRVYITESFIVYY